jgi:Helix-turn-helix domain
MSAMARDQARWDADDYSRILSAHFDEETTILTVRFADGDEARLDPSPLVPSNLTDVDWWRVASNQIEIVVPHAAGWYEIPWDVVRRRTDPEYAAYWERVTLEHAQETGARLRALRQRRRLTINDLAKRAQLSDAELARMENGDSPQGLSELQIVLGAMNCSLADLTEQSIDMGERSREPLAGLPHIRRSKDR